MHKLKIILILAVLTAFLGMLLISNGCEWGGT